MDLLSVSTEHLLFSLFAAKDSRNDCCAKIDYQRCGKRKAFSDYLLILSMQCLEWSFRVGYLFSKSALIYICNIHVYIYSIYMSYI